MKNKINIAIPIAPKDVELAEALLSLIAHLSEGSNDDIEYFLIVDFPIENKLRKLCERFLSIKKGKILDSGVNKESILKVKNEIKVKSDSWHNGLFIPWNMILKKIIEELVPSSFFTLLIEPDACIMRDNWLSPIISDVKQSPSWQPIVGNLKSGIINNKRIYTHWAGCSCYKPNINQILNSDILKTSVKNPWFKDKKALGEIHPNIWTYTEELNPASCSLDLCLYTFFMNQRYETLDYNKWPQDELFQSKNIKCMYGTTESWHLIYNDLFNKISIFHHQKSPRLNLEILKAFGGIKLI